MDNVAPSAFGSWVDGAFSMCEPSADDCRVIRSRGNTVWGGVPVRRMIPLAGARGDCSEEEQMNEFACSRDGELTDDDGFNRSKSGLK